MKINYKNPIIYSLCSMCITFVISVIMIFLIKPLYIMEVPNNSNIKKKKINWYLLFNYSFLFASLIGIVVLLFKTDHGKKPRFGFSIYNKRAYRPVSYSVNTGNVTGT